MKNKKKKAFTLIELIVVIAILGILAAIAIPKFSKFTSTAKDQSDKVSATTIKNAFALDRSNGVFANTADVTVTIKYTDGKTKVAAADITTSPNDATGITDTASQNIVLKAVDGLVLQGGKDIKITITKDDGPIKAELID